MVVILIRDGEFRPPEWQQRRIGKMEQHGAECEDDQGTILEESSPICAFACGSDRAGVACLLSNT